MTLKELGFLLLVVLASGGLLTTCAVGLKALAL